MKHLLAGFALIMMAAALGIGAGGYEDGVDYLPVPEFPDEVAVASIGLPASAEAAVPAKEPESWYENDWVVVAGMVLAAALLIADNDDNDSDRPKMESSVKPLPMPEMKPPAEEEAEEPDMKDMPEEDPMENPDPIDPEDEGMGEDEGDMDEEEGTEDEEVADEEMTEPELNPEQIAWGKWNDVRQAYDISATAPAPMHNDMAMTMSGMKPPANFSYTGDIDGTIAPTADGISDPKITLRVNNPVTGINAEVHWLYAGRDERVTMARYGARLNEDGTFSSFSAREDGMPVDGNASGFNGAFYDGGQTHDAVAGFVSTPRVYGSYKAMIE